MPPLSIYTHIYKNIKEGGNLSNDVFQNGKNSYLWIVGSWVK